MTASSGSASHSTTPAGFPPRDPSVNAEICWTIMLPHATRRIESSEWQTGKKSFRPLFAIRYSLFAILILRREFDRVLLRLLIELEDFAENAGRHRRDRIDA